MQCSEAAPWCRPVRATLPRRLCPEKGGFYANIGADVIFHKRLGFGFDADWRGSQGQYGGEGGQPYRPILFDFNGVWQPRISKKVGADLFGGIGWQTTRFYLPYCTSSFTCNNYTSSNHFLVDVGGGIRYYVWGHVFVRPEARFYHILNNTDVLQFRQRGPRRSLHRIHYRWS